MYRWLCLCEDDGMIKEVVDGTTFSGCLVTIKCRVLMIGHPIASPTPNYNVLNGWGKVWYRCI